MSKPKKKFRVHLTSGTTIVVKADDFLVSWDDDGFNEWEVKGAERWFMIHPRTLAGVERIK